MGRKKKTSTRCKTSKREHKHKNKSLKSSPAVNQYQIPLNQIIDNGKSSKFIHGQLLKEKQRKTPKKYTLSPAAKLKIDEFLFGTSSKHSKHTNNQKDDDSKNGDIEMTQSAADDDSKKDHMKSVDDNIKNNHEINSKYDTLKISNLDRRVNEKIITKIINKKLSQYNSAIPLQISLKSVSILSLGASKIAKIILKKPTENGLSTLSSQIIKLLNGKTLFGKILECECLTI